MTWVDMLVGLNLETSALEQHLMLLLHIFKWGDSKIFMHSLHLVIHWLTTTLKPSPWYYPSYVILSEHGDLWRNPVVPGIRTLAVDPLGLLGLLVGTPSTIPLHLLNADLCRDLWKLTSSACPFNCTWTMFVVWWQGCCGWLHWA